MLDGEPKWGRIFGGWSCVSSQQKCKDFRWAFFRNTSPILTLDKDIQVTRMSSGALPHDCSYYCAFYADALLQASKSLNVRWALAVREKAVESLLIALASPQPTNFLQTAETKTSSSSLESSNFLLHIDRVVFSYRTHATNFVACRSRPKNESWPLSVRHRSACSVSSRNSHIAGWSTYLQPLICLCFSAVLPSLRNSNK